MLDNMEADCAIKAYQEQTIVAREKSNKLKDRGNEKEKIKENIVSTHRQNS